MNRNTKAFFIICMTGLLLLAFSGLLSARTVWVGGIVTKSPWVETYQYIEVDEVKYALMPKDVRIERRYQTYSGIIVGEEITLRDIRVGQNIAIRVQGHRIYQIIVEDF